MTRKICFMEWDRRNEAKLPAAYRVMVFEPCGQYPRGTYWVPNGFFHADDSIAFSVVHGESWQQLDPDAPFSEFDWASPQELRLMTSLVLCELRQGPYIGLYPIVRYSPWLDASELNLQHPDTVQEVRAVLLDEVKRSRRTGQTPEPSEARLLRLDRAYSLTEPCEYALNRLPQFWQCVKPTNYLLLRGTYALIKSDMLSRHYEFWEEAIISVYIAMEASFSLVLRRLELEGYPNPTARDAARWLHRHFDRYFGLEAPETTSKYFEEFYQQRIATLHPASRFGDLPYAPIMHDDLIHLRRSLREIFSYLALGAHSTDFYEDVREHSRFIEE